MTERCTEILFPNIAAAQQLMLVALLAVIVCFAAVASFWIIDMLLADRRKRLEDRANEVDFR